MRGILLFIFGYVSLSAERARAHEIMNLCMERGYVYRDLRFEGDRIYLSCSLGTAKKLSDACGARGIEIVRLRERGVPSLLGRYRRRYGFFAGLALFAAIFFLSGTVIWGIKIDGNARLSEREVLSELRRCGLSVGSRKSGLDVSSIENRVLIESDEISWISVNIIGTVAEVEIREIEVEEEREQYLASNIVAARDGQIELFEDVRGNIVLNIGDYVRKGELIVSGLYDSQTQGIRYTDAKGRVLARTERDISVSIPLKYEKKRYTGRVFTEKYLIFFEKEIKIYTNAGNLYASCDTIDTVEYINFFSAGELPVGVRTVKHMEYVYEDAERTPEEAERLADYKLSCELAALADDGELLRKSKVYRVTDTAYIIDCHIQRIENIAERREIKIEGLS